MLTWRREQSLIPIRPQHQQRQRKTAIRRRRKLRLQCRSQDWMAVLQRATETRRQNLHLHLQLRSGRLRNGKRVGAHGKLHHLRNGGEFRFPGKNSRKSAGECRQDTHSLCTSVQYSLFTSAERTSRAWLKGQHGSSHTDCSVIFVRLKRICHLVLHMSHPLLLSHLPFTTSTSSSSFTLLSTTTPEHAAQSGQHDLLQEHPVHHQFLQDLPVDKRRHQEPFWRENLQSGGNQNILHKNPEFRCTRILGEFAKIQ